MLDVINLIQLLLEIWTFATKTMGNNNTKETFNPIILQLNVLSLQKIYIIQ